MSSPASIGFEASVARAKKKKHPFSVKSFLSKANGGRTITSYRKNEKIFSQGDRADAVFYIQEGKVKVCVTSKWARRQSLPCTEKATSLAKDA
jgi:hypothetical protein